MSSEQWRVGEHYGIHVYAGREPVATFHRTEDAARAVDAVNGYRPDDVWAEPAREAVARWLFAEQGSTPAAWDRLLNDNSKAVFRKDADRLLSLPAVRAWAGERR